GEGPQARFRLRKRLAHGEHSGDDPLDIAVDGGGAMIEGDGGDRRGGIIADPGKGAQLGRIFGELAAMAFDDGAGAGMQIAGTGVVAEPLPEMQNVVERGRGESLNVGK